MVRRADEPLWELRRVNKVFPGVHALKDVSAAIYPGEVHGLFGENGSGKSTLVKCLSGVYRPTSGSLVRRGAEVSINSPRDAQRLGVATIYQEFSLVPNLTVAENISLGRMARKRWASGLIDWPATRERAARVLEKLQIDMDPGALLDDLSVAEKQMVEIAKALSMEASLFIFDEPTAAIGASDIKNLHRIVRQLASSGCAIIYISHRMDEVLEIVDTITVLKDGLNQGTVDRENITIGEIVRMMTGADVTEHYPKQRHVRPEVLLTAKDVVTANGANGVSLTLQRGEVLGLAGLIGSGRTEIARALFAVDPIRSGCIDVAQRRRPKKQTIQKAIRDGLSMVTEDRKKFGLFMNFEGPKNTSIASLRKFVRFFFLDLDRELSVFREYLSKFALPAHSAVASVETLSGGNQQKIVLSRWLESDAEVFILDEPTRGIDVGAKVEVYHLINELTAKGKGVILISSDYEELLAMSDRLAFVTRGKVTREEVARDLTHSQMMQLLYSQGRPAAVAETAGELA